MTLLKHMNENCIMLKSAISWGWEIAMHFGRGGGGGESGSVLSLYSESEIRSLAMIIDIFVCREIRRE